MKELLSQKGIDYKYVDVTESMKNLKEFLKYRDNSAVFENVKKIGAIGLPSMVVNDGEYITLNIREYFL